MQAEWWRESPDLAWGSSRMEGTLFSIFCSLISSESGDGSAVPAWLVTAQGGMSSPKAGVNECQNCPYRRAACQQPPKGAGTEVHGSLRQFSGHGYTVAGFHPLSAQTMAPPSLLENKPERFEDENQHKGSPFPLPHCWRISISHKEGLQDQSSSVNPIVWGGKPAPLPPEAACEPPPPWRGAQEPCHRGKLILPDLVLQRCKASADSFT